MKQAFAQAAAILVASLLLPRFHAQATGTITGVVTTKAIGSRPIRVTIDQRVCGNELPDEAVLVDGSGSSCECRGHTDWREGQAAHRQAPAS